MLSASPSLGPGSCRVSTLLTGDRTKIRSPVLVFCFSLSCCAITSRVLGAAGSLSGGINKEGVAFYNNLINELIANGNLRVHAESTNYDIDMYLKKGKSPQG